MPIQQLQEMPTQPLMGHMTSPPPLSNQAHLLGLDAGGQQLLHAPLQPADPGISQDTMQAIQDLQLLLQPPGLGMGNKIEHSQPPNIAQSQPPERGVTMDKAHESQVPTEHTIENTEESMTNEQLPSGHVLEQDHRGNESMPPQFDDMEPAVSEGEMQPEAGSTLPDVLQVQWCHVGSVRVKVIRLLTVVQRLARFWFSYEYHYAATCTCMYMYMWAEKISVVLLSVLAALYNF